MKKHDKRAKRLAGFSRSYESLVPLPWDEVLYEPQNPYLRDPTVFKLPCFVPLRDEAGEYTAEEMLKPISLEYPAD